MLNKEIQAGTEVPQSTEADVPTSAKLLPNPLLSAALSTREANLLIAGFMGYDDYKQTGAVIKDASMKFVLCYDLNWSEIMPVIEKIDSLHELTNGEVYCQTNATSHTFYIKYNSGNVVRNFHPKYNGGRHRCEGETRIENVFWAIVEFIMWTNQNGVSFGSI